MSAPSTAAPTQQVNVADLELSQLVEVKRQLEEVRSDILRSQSSSLLIRFLLRQELSHLTSSFAQLKQAQAKFRSCIESAKEVKRENKGTMLAPICIFYMYARALG
jgi:prefoldin alpha subunit